MSIKRDPSKYKDALLEHLKPIYNESFFSSIDKDKVLAMDLFTKKEIRELYERLVTPVARLNNDILIIGAGGVCSWFIPELIKILYNYKIKNRLLEPINITLVDNDTVSKRNLLRQNFIPEDIGKNKAQVLAERYSEVYEGVIVNYNPKYFISSTFFTSLLDEEADYNDKYSNISTVGFKYIFNMTDNEFTKHMIDYAIYKESYHNAKYTPYYLSAGCDVNNGNVVVFNTLVDTYTTYFKESTFEEEDADIDTPECAVIAERATAEQTFDSNNVAANVLAVLFNNLLTDPLSFDTRRVNFTCTRYPSVEVVDKTDFNHLSMYKLVFDKQIDEIAKYLIERDYEFKRSSKGKELKRRFDFHKNYSSGDLMDYIKSMELLEYI